MSFVKKINFSTFAWITQITIKRIKKWYYPVAFTVQKKNKMVVMPKFFQTKGSKSISIWHKIKSKVIQFHVEGEKYKRMEVCTLWQYINNEIQRVLDTCMNIIQCIQLFQVSDTLSSVHKISVKITLKTWIKGGERRAEGLFTSRLSTAKCEMQMISNCSAEHSLPQRVQS